MAKLTEADRTRLKADIHQHLHITGPREWDGLMAKWTDVPRSTFFRLVKEVRDEITSEAAKSPSPAALEVAQRRIRSAPEPVAPADTDAHLPRVGNPSPAVVARLGDRGARHLELMGRYDFLWRDYLMMRESAIKRDETGRESVKNLQAMDKSLRQGREITEAQIRAMADVYNMEQITDMYSVVMEEIGKASPDVQHAILVRLRAANNRLAMTVNAEVR